MTEEKPLIYTTLGNVPVEELEHYVAWDIQPDYIKFREVFMRDGEIVKESAHVHHLKGVQLGAEQFS